MPDENYTKSVNVGEMHKRREIMSDGKRYLIYYTFDTPTAASDDVKTKFTNGEVKSENA